MNPRYILAAFDYGTGWQWVKLDATNGAHFAICQHAHNTGAKRWDFQNYIKLNY